MNPSIQRFLPIILIAFVLLFVLPSLLKKKSSSGPSAKTQAAQAIDAATVIDRGEQDYKRAHGKFTSSLADLVQLHPRLAGDLGIGLAVTLDAGTGGQSYVQQVVGSNLTLVRARAGAGAKLIAANCTVVKSASGVACPAASGGS